MLMDNPIITRIERWGYDEPYCDWEEDEQDELKGDGENEREDAL